MAVLLSSRAFGRKTTMTKGETRALGLFLMGFWGAAIATLIFKAIMAAPVLTLFLAGFTFLTFFVKSE
jgi:hypothetical protein